MNNRRPKLDPLALARVKRAARCPDCDSRVTDDGGANHDKVVRWTLAPPARPEMAGDGDPPDPPDPHKVAPAGHAGHAGHESGPSQEDPALRGVASIEQEAA